MSELDLVVPDDAEREALGGIASHAFAFPQDDAPRWFAQAGHENLRAVRVAGRVVAGLVVIPMGQFFGGRAVSMTGIAGVAVAPEARGTGVGTRMMAATLRELRAKGMALSTLYPATVPLYRRAGYERAGVYGEIEIHPRIVQAGDRGLEVVPTDADDPELPALYRAFAARRTGYLDRGPYVWSRVFKPRGAAPTRALKVRHDGVTEGYVVLTHKQGDGGPGHDTVVLATDLVAVTRRAAERLLSLLADYGSLAGAIQWRGASPDVFTMLLRDRRHEIRTDEHWMLRIVDVERALGERGFPRHVATELGIEIDDPLLAENAGRWSVRVEEGRASVRRGGDGAIRCDVRGLAALYSGYLPARSLALTGHLEGSDDALERAESIFAGPAPALADFF